MKKSKNPTVWKNRIVKTKVAGAFFALTTQHDDIKGKVQMQRIL